MSYWQTPEAIARVAEANVKVLLVVDGIALWDLLSSIKFDIQMLRTDKRTKWSFWVYMTIRVLLLANIGTNIAGFNTPVEINCQAWAILLHFTILCALALSQLLVLLRLLALWNGHPILKLAPCLVWAAQVGIYIYIIANASIHAVWLPAPQNACFVEDTNRNIIYISLTFVVDTMLSVITVATAYRHRMLPLGRLILKHGIAWVILATLSELPPLILLALNLNAPWNIILQTPAGFTMIIACTHMYRTLIKFGSSPHTQFSDPPSYLGGRRVPGSRSGQNSASGALNISQPHPIELRPMFDGDGALSDMKKHDGHVVLGDGKTGSRIV